MAKRLLIVEDNKTKREKIKEFVEELHQGWEVHDAVSYTGGMRRIYEEDWSVILLDMSLPTYDMTEQNNGGEKTAEAGRDIMRRMLNRKILIPVIIITQFESFGEKETSLDTLNGIFKERMSEIWKGTVHYDNSTSQWKQETKALLDEIAAG